MAATESAARVDAPSVTGGAAAPITATLLLAAAVCLVAGVRVWELLAFAAYQAVFVVAPGVVVLRAVLRGAMSRATLLAIGWPLGLALELGAFAATAAVGARWLFAVYPVVVLAACGPLAWHRRGEVPPERRVVPRLALWAMAAAAGAAVVLLAMHGFATNALPRDVPSVVPYVDNVFDVAVAAEARHHWPIENPNVSGQPLRYHVLAFVDAAAVNQITGIELDVIVLRLQPLLVVLLVALEVAWLAVRAAGRVIWAMPGAVAITLLANEIDLDLDRDSPFGGIFFNNIPLSPTFALGLPFFIAATGVLLHLLTARREASRGWWLVLAALSLCAMGAKASTLPVLIVALGAFVVSRLVLDRTVDRIALKGLAVVAAAFVVMYVALFRGGASGTTLAPLSWVDYTALAGHANGAFLLLAAVVATAGLMAPWVGAVLLVGRLEGRERTAALWLAAVIVGAVVPYMALGAPGDAQAYFFLYGVPAGAVLSAWGIARTWPTIAGRIGLVPALAAVGALAMVGIAVAQRLGALAPYALVGLGVAAGVALLYRRHRASALSIAVTAIVALTLLDVPLDIAPFWARDELHGTPHHFADIRTGPRGIDEQLLTGLRWLRGHSRPDDVLAVDVQTLAEGTSDARYFVYAAYAERRTFIGGWLYATDAVGIDPGAATRLFAQRQRLNDAAFRGDRGAIATLRTRYGVQFLLVDLRHGPPQPALDRTVRRVYANPALRVYAAQG